MLYSEEQAEIILNHRENLVNKIDTVGVELKEIRHGGDKRKQPSTAERKVIGAMARSGLGNRAEISKEFDVSVDTVTNYAHGRVTRLSDDGYKEHPELKIEEQLSPIRERALEKLMSSLGVITDDKLKVLSAPQASLVASQMSKVVKNTMPEVHNNDNRTQIVIMTPKQKDLEDYQMVEV